MADVEIDLEITDPKELMGLGLRAFAIRDFSSAAAALGKSTQLMAQEHGDEHDSLGELYLHYARALLEVSREEAEPLGDAIPHGDSESESSQEDDDETVENDNKEEGENKDSDQKEETENKEESDDKKEETNEVEAAVNGVKTNGEASGIENGESSGISGNLTDTVDKNEDCSDLQLAWEVLEVAKKIFTARGDGGKELLAQTLILLGEVGMESENFTDGVKDINDGLEIQETLYEKSSRKLAETYYKIGTAHCTLSNIDDAVKYFKLSIDTLNKRIEELKKTESDENKSEIEEIKSLIPKIEEKINDTKLIIGDTVKMLMDVLNKPTEEGEGTSSGSSTKDATDISHLVKRKRKPDDTPESNDVQPSKRPTP